MAIEIGLRTLLLQQPAITALVPQQAVGRATFPCVFCEYAAQGVEPPFILVSLIDHDPLKALDGTSDSLAFTEVDIDAYSHRFDTALQIAKKVSDFLKDYTGVAGTDDYIEAVLWEDKRHDRIQERDGRDVRGHIVSNTFIIQHRAV
jgi:hypothetical protein